MRALSTEELESHMHVVWLRAPISSVLTLDVLLSFKPDLFLNESLLLLKLTGAFFTQADYLQQR